MPSAVRVTFCCSPGHGATPAADGSVSVKIRADASIREILRRLGGKFPQFAGGQRLLLLPPPRDGADALAGEEEASGAAAAPQELTSAQQLQGGERLLVLSDRPAVCEQGRPADAVEARVWERALPPELLDALTRELTRNHRAASRSALAGEKMHTWWLPLTADGVATRACPSKTVPAAIRHLHRLAFGEGSGWEGELPIGAEWWVQRRPLDCEISFHYDKDEALSSSTDDLRMVCPLRSTVTYLDSLGSPTMILNTSSVDGAAMQPPGMPRQALLSYPKQNKHLLFRGDLLHGVPASLHGGGMAGRGGAATAASGGGGAAAAGKEIVKPRTEDGEDLPEVDAEAVPMRMTFLVNWWHVRPGEPNCRAFTAGADFPLGPQPEPEPEPEPGPEPEPSRHQWDHPGALEMQALSFDLGAAAADAENSCSNGVPEEEPSSSSSSAAGAGAATGAVATTEHAIALGSALWSFALPTPPPPAQSWSDYAHVNVVNGDGDGDGSMDDGITIAPEEGADATAAAAATTTRYSGSTLRVTF